MEQKVLETLLNAAEQLQSCNSAGTTRGVATDAYSCIDSCWSVLAHLAGRPPHRNHKQKLDAEFPTVSTELLASDVSYADIESLYRLWLDVRYSQANVTPNHAFKVRMQAQAVFDVVLQVVARKEGTTAPELEEELYKELFGNRFQAYQVNRPGFGGGSNL